MLQDDKTQKTQQLLGSSDFLGFLETKIWCPEEDLNLHDHKSLTPEASASTIPPSGLRARTVKVGLGHCQSAHGYMHAGL